MTASRSKRCFKCREEKFLSAFYRHPKMADGHLGKCKECTKRDVTENRTKKIDYYQAYDRQRFIEDPRRRQANAARMEIYKGDGRQDAWRARWDGDNPHKRRAHQAVFEAKKAGILVPQPCEFCGGVDDIEAHHDDYDKPLDVRWLCPKHHGHHHAVARGNRAERDIPTR